MAELGQDGAVGGGERNGEIEGEREKTEVEKQMENKEIREIKWRKREMEKQQYEEGENR